MANVAGHSGEGGDSAYASAQAALSAHRAAASQNAASLEQLEATMTAVDFNRDAALMAHIHRMNELQKAMEAEAAAAHETLVNNHQQGAEYHGTGRDAKAEAYR